ncbi:motility associated factor glycosyltransferase family protein [bacterium]|nr:motility associated factor glycosyltransferase family protein [bacterium]
MDEQNIFEKNMVLLEKANPELAALMSARHESGVALDMPAGWQARRFDSKTGLEGIELATSDERRVSLTSRYDPEREAEQYIERHSEDFGSRNYFAIIGFGAGYHVSRLVKDLCHDAMLVIAEASPEIFYHAMSIRDLSDILAYPRLALSVGDDPDVFVERCNRIFNVMTFRGLNILEWDYYVDTPFSEKYDEIRNKLRAQMLQVAGNLQTMMAMGHSYTVNSLLNFKYLVKEPSVKNLLGRFDGIPGVVISAGPSLSKNAHLLKEVGDRALICAVDTAVKPLLKMGIEPHIVATGDPQEANYRHLKGVVMPNTSLVCDPQAPIKTVSEWAGNRFFCSFGTRFFHWFESRMDVGRVDVWGSVATIAYDLVLQMGCDPIIFIGQDLAFSWGRTYTEGTYFEDDDKNDMSVEAFEAKDKRLIKMKDIYGNDVPTNRQMFAYFDFFQKRFAEPHGRRIVNATEGGIMHGPNIEVDTFQNAIDKYCTEVNDIKGMLDEAYGEGNSYRLVYVSREMDRLILEFRNMMKYAKKGYKFSEELGKLLETEDFDSAEVREAYNRMIRLRNDMDRLNEAKPFLEMVNQAGLYLYFTRLQNIELPNGAIDKDAILQINKAMNVLFASCLSLSAQLLPHFENARDDIGKIIAGKDKDSVVLTV